MRRQSEDGEEMFSLCILDDLEYFGRVLRNENLVDDHHWHADAGVGHLDHETARALTFATLWTLQAQSIV